METKYGKVYVLERETDSNGKEVVMCKLLEGIRFNNTNHKWYTTNGEPSSLYENYKGRQISVQFNINQKDKLGQQVDFKAKVLLPVKLGDLPPQDFKGYEAATQKNIKLWERFGVLSGDEDTDDGYRFVRNCRAVQFAITVSAGYKISGMKLLCAFLDPYTLLDNFTDKPTFQHGMSFKAAQKFWSAISDILEGKLLADNNEAQTKILKHVPKEYQLLSRGSLALREIITEKEEYAEDVCQAFRKHQDAISLENSREWKQVKDNPASNMYHLLLPELRDLCAGANITLESALFDQNILIGKELRESFLFKSLYRSCCQHFSLFNDLISLKKEMAEGAASNIVYILHDRDGLSLEESFQKTIDKMTKLTHIVAETGDLFISLHKQQPEVAKFVELIKYVMYGNIQFTVLSERYQPKMVFDCVVELE